MKRKESAKIGSRTRTYITGGLSLKDSREIYGHAAALITIALWGTTFISTKILLNSFTPVEILFLRFVVGYAVLFLAYPHRLKTGSFREEGLLMLAGLCGITLYYLLENTALTYSFASNVGLIVSISPFFTAIFAHFLLKGEKLRFRFLLGFLSAIAGVLLIDYNGSVILKLNPLGDLLAVGAAVIWAMYSILMKKISLYGYHTVACTRRVFFYGLIFMLPFLFFGGKFPDVRQLIVPVNLGNLLFLSLGASALCFVTWNWAVGILGAVKTSVYIYLVPLITITASVLILKEKITPVAGAGAVLTIAGLFLSEWKPRFKQVKLKEAEHG
jgi:drug/metabolite transporter (DMT)-like permease